MLAIPPPITTSRIGDAKDVPNQKHGTESESIIYRDMTRPLRGLDAPVHGQRDGVWPCL
jgi:hypothetical protein